MRHSIALVRSFEYEFDFFNLTPKSTFFKNFFSLEKKVLKTENFSDEDALIKKRFMYHVKAFVLNVHDMHRFRI